MYVHVLRVCTRVAATGERDVWRNVSPDGCSRGFVKVIVKEQEIR